MTTLGAVFRPAAAARTAPPGGRWPTAIARLADAVAQVVPLEERLADQLGEVVAAW